ncbi:MAG: cell division protein WhiA [Chloroflexota bacterium]|jgi:DNA-binding transcriptional regulator WhiA|nr:cell division protein WhiA [Chloroflexota bacterium]
MQLPISHRPPPERLSRQPSFGSDARHELALQFPARACCRDTEVSGVLAAARAREVPGGLALLVTSSAVARKLVRLAQSLERARDAADVPGEGHFRRGATHVRPTYEVTLRPGPQLPARAPTRACCRRAYLRAAFMTAGDVSIGTSGTHLEFRLSSELAARQVAEVLQALEVRPRTRRRGPRWLVYVKGSEDLILLLQAMGASHAVLRFQNERILREVRAQANRAANSETANLRRSVATGLRQAGAARRLVHSGLLDTQPQALREVAHARIAAPTATLDGLAARLHISKSATNARLRRLLTLAGELGLVD